VFRGDDRCYGVFRGDLGGGYGVFRGGYRVFRGCYRVFRFCIFLNKLSVLELLML